MQHSQSSDVSHPTPVPAVIRVLVLTRRRASVAPWLLELEHCGAAVETIGDDPRDSTAPPLGTFDVIVSFPDSEEATFISDLRAGHPDAYFAVMVPSRSNVALQTWLSTGFDGLFSADEPAALAAARILAAARYAHRLRHINVAQRQAGSLTLNYATRVAMLNGNRLDLTAYEFSILATLTRNLGVVLSRQQLLEQAKGSADEAFDRSIDVQISRLRAKLGDDPRRPMLLKTVRGKGYVLVPGTL